MILFNVPIKVWTHIHCLKNQIHTRLATVHLLHTPPGQVNCEPPSQTLRQKFEKTDGPYIVPWRSMDAGSARPLGEVNSWAEDVSQRKQSLHSPDVQIQGVSAKTLWLVSAVKIALRGGQEEILGQPQSKLHRFTGPNWWCWIHIIGIDTGTDAWKQTQYAGTVYFVRNLSLDRVAHTWYSCVIIL